MLLPATSNLINVMNELPTQSSDYELAEAAASRRFNNRELNARVSVSTKQKITKNNR